MAAFRFSHSADALMAAAGDAEQLRSMLDDMARQLEDYLGRRLVFSWFGTPTTAASGPDNAIGGGRLATVVVLLASAGTTATVVTVYRNGVALSPAVTVAIAATRGTAYLGVSVSPTDVITVAVTTVGSGALSPTVYIGY